jgi:hypothetical protein
MKTCYSLCCVNCQCCIRCMWEFVCCWTEIGSLVELKMVRCKELYPTNRTIHSCSSKTAYCHVNLLCKKLCITSPSVLFLYKNFFGMMNVWRFRFLLLCMGFAVFSKFRVKANVFRGETGLGWFLMLSFS